MPGCQVVKAYPGGSELFASSINRVEGFTNAVSNAESLEVIAFLEAASRSRAAGGATIKLDEL